MDREALSQFSKDELIAPLLAQEARIAELERRLGLNSSNSGKPPSSDGLKKPPRVSSLGEPSGKKTGGQKGHPGETLRRVEEPDATMDHYPETCAACGEPLSAVMATGHLARQVFDLPEPRPLIVTEHRAHACRCAACGTLSMPVEISPEVPIENSPFLCCSGVNRKMRATVLEAVKGRAPGRAPRAV